MGILGDIIKSVVPDSVKLNKVNNEIRKRSWIERVGADIFLSDEDKIKKFDEEVDKRL